MRSQYQLRDIGDHLTKTSFRRFRVGGSIVALLCARRTTYVISSLSSLRNDKKLRNVVRR